MKHEWRKKEKELYLPKNKPVFLEVPSLQFMCIKGEGNPDGEEFANCVTLLYALSYAIKMAPKKGKIIEGYFDYTVYPLEGIWDLNKEAQKNYDGTFNKDDLVYTLMIRQPDFVSKELLEEIKEEVYQKKKLHRLDRLYLKEIKEGKCIQMLHLGPFEDEPASFKRMEEFAESK